ISHGLLIVIYFLPLAAQERDYDFGVRLGRKAVAVLLKLFFENRIIFDYSVMNEGEGAASVRMCVLFGGSAMGCPPRMRHTNRTADRELQELVLQTIELAFAPDDLKPGIGSHHCYPGAVVAPIFQPPEPVYKNFPPFIRTDVSHYAAHNVNSCPFVFSWKQKHSPRRARRTQTEQLCYRTMSEISRNQTLGLMSSLWSMLFVLLTDCKVIFEL